MYKIYDCIGHTHTPGYLLKKYGVPFEIDQRNRWQLVSNVQEADLIICIPEHFSIDVAVEISRPDQTIVILDLWHMDNHSGTQSTIDNTIKYHNIQHRKVVWVHENYWNQNPKYAYHDMMFNRSKAYFTDYEKLSDPHNKVWTIATTRQVYDLAPIEFHGSRKRFLAPMRVYGKGTRMERRRQLRDVLAKRTNDGFMNDTENKVFFECNDPNASPDLRGYVEKPDGGTWYPISNRYYNESYCSIFIESVTDSEQAILATEKTFDPLIKGHYILPFSSANYVKWLKEYYGFRFPEWIDYSYESETNHDARFFKFLASVVNYLEIPQTSIVNWAKNSKDILEHNRGVFYNRPYHSLYEAIEKCIKFNGF